MTSSNARAAYATYAAAAALTVAHPLGLGFLAAACWAIACAMFVLTVTTAARR